MPATEVRVFQVDHDNSPFLDWLRDLQTSQPRAYAKCLYLLLALADHGSELRRPLADSLRDGIRELRGKIGSANYRILYAFIGGNVVIVSHGLTKQAQVPDSEIDLAIERVALAKKDPLKHTVLFDRDEL